MFLEGMGKIIKKNLQQERLRHGQNWELEDDNQKHENNYIQQEVTQCLLSCLWRREFSRDVAAEAGFLCDKATVFGDIIKETSCTIHLDKQVVDVWDVVNWLMIKSKRSLGY